MDHDYQHHGSFSVLNGVAVKVGDKFQPPVRVLLPNSWSGVDVEQLLTYQYDFSKESEAINLANEQNLLQQRQVEEDERKREEEKMLFEQNKIDTTCVSNVENNGIACIETTNILLPQVMRLEKTPEIKTDKQVIDFHEFESQNVNPFETVELQTLNMFDELQSVLDPTSVKQKQREFVTPTPNDVDLSIFSTERPVTQENNLDVQLLIDPAVSQPTHIFDTRPHQITPVFNNSGMLAWTKFDQDASYTYKQTSIHHNTEVAQKPENVFNGQTTMVRTKSLPNLYDPVTPSANDSMCNGCNSSSETLNAPPPPIDTNRINNIMQQYRFERIATTTTTTPLSSSTIPPMHTTNPFYAHNNNPFLQINNTLNNKQTFLNATELNLTNHSVSPVLISPQNVQQSSATTPLCLLLPTKSHTLSPLPINKEIANNNDLHSSSLPTLPAISPTKLTTISWLTDQTTFLTAIERKFAIQVSAMGFPLARVSRAISWLGMDEKEVLDFLFLVEQTKQPSHSDDDIEMALITCYKDKEKVPKYLELVATFRELGFQPCSIHNALRDSDLDQNKALDFLTR